MNERIKIDGEEFEISYSTLTERRQEINLRQAASDLIKEAQHEINLMKAVLKHQQRII